MNEADGNVYGYAVPVWARFRAPRHAGRLGARASLVAEAGSAAAQSLLRIELACEAGRVRSARFQAYGCPTAIAVGEWLAERLEREPVAAWAAIDATRIRAALEIAEDKAHCALMGEDVLRALMAKMAQATSGM